MKIKFKSQFTPEQKLLFAMGGVPERYAQAWAAEKAAREAAQREQDIEEASELCREAQVKVVEGPCVGAEWVPGTYNTYPAALAVVGGKIYRYVHSGYVAEEDYLPLVGRYDGKLLPGQVDPAIEAEKARIEAEAEKAEKARIEAEKARRKAEAEQEAEKARIEAKRAARLEYAAERERAAAEARQHAENAAKENAAKAVAEKEAFRAAANPFAALAALKGGR